MKQFAPSSTVQYSLEAAGARPAPDAVMQDSPRETKRQGCQGSSDTWWLISGFQTLRALPRCGSAIAASGSGVLAATFYMIDMFPRLGYVCQD